MTRVGCSHRAMMQKIVRTFKRRRLDKVLSFNNKKLRQNIRAHVGNV